MKVFLDDEHATPEGWVHAWTSLETIRLLETGAVVEVSLDHDLGEPESRVGNGYLVLAWIEEQAASGNRAVVPAIIRTHTANPVARQRMLAAIASIKRLMDRSSTA